MQNKALAQDYVLRALSRHKSIQVLFDDQNWADVMRECQEAVELALKGMLRHLDLEPPRVHDVGPLLLDSAALFPKKIQEHLPRLAEISRQLRRDRELAFYGSEDLTPSQFYTRNDAQEALESCGWVAKTAFEFVMGGRSVDADRADRKSDSHS